jgi:lipopolysaccharide biosynthesis protein
LANPDIDLRFCLNWANESWSRRWDGSETDVLMSQGYLPGDEERYVDSIAPAVRDPRYIRIDGRPLFMVYRPTVIPDIATSMAAWRKRFRELELGEPFIVMPQVFDQFDPRPMGFDAAAGFPPHGGWDIPDDRHWFQLYDKRFIGSARSYERLARQFEAVPPAEYRLFPGCCPMWDNEARKPRRGQGFYGSTPARYGAWLEHAARRAAAVPEQDQRIVFINAWNEWAEGTYLEPDRHYGAAYLAETRRVLDVLAGKALSGASGPEREPLAARKSYWNRGVNLVAAVKRRLTSGKG